ncbi:uncharacterized protein LOC106663741 isoform X1 [Cimex lectularius]|uniref:Uncharacterized protein n=1 Tax=Cimex lectularius TaxID=79782 RepID=A0A8I6RLH6_CIMLE|nr:uncharacterized protein LOC106663741 isoform X1 [Cimex lectularius]
MESDYESLLSPVPEELPEVPFVKLEEPADLPTDRIKRILEGDEINTFMDREDLEEVLLRRVHEEQGGGSYLYILPYIVFLIVFAFFGWKLYQSLKDKEKKREEKKKQKQKKKK